MPKLLHKGDISPRVRPVPSQSEQAFPDLSPSTSQPAIATRRTGFDARRSKPSANDGCSQTISTHRWPAGAGGCMAAEGQSRRTQSGPVVDILRSTPKSSYAWPRHPATISPTIFAIRAFDRITGRPDACASCRRCASTKPMQSSSSASAPLRTSETPLAVTTSSVSV